MPQIGAAVNRNVGLPGENRACFLKRPALLFRPERQGQSAGRMKRAEYGKRLEDGRVRCGLCPHGCALAEGQTGRCGVRRAAGGVLEAAGYGRLSAAHLDPIEKKPLYHVHPGCRLYSIGLWGCNLSCRFCQNWQISQQADLSAPAVQPATVVAEARAQGAAGIAYTYNEPLVHFEFVRDCAAQARRAGLLNVLVTNGFVEEAPAAALLPLTDALNLDIKSLDESFYARQCGGALAPVLRFARQAAGAGRRLEITNLLIPGLNDSPEQVGRLAAWVAEHLGRRTPLHLSAYHPDYRMDLPSTSAAGLERAWTRARQDLDYVYVGNLPAAYGQDTRCPGCGETLVERRGYAARRTGLRGRACARCGRPADLDL